VISLFKERGIDTSIIDKVTLEVKDSVSRLSLSKIKSTDELLDLYLRYKTTQKTVSSYGEKFLRHVNPFSGRIHSSFLQIMSTGRTSSINPNLQNIKRESEFRSAFECDKDYVLISADFSNQEARIIADKSGDENMQSVFEKGTDFHLETAKIAFSNPNLTKDTIERQQAKSINFLVAFGGGPKKLSEQFGIPLSRAKDLIRTYFEAFSLVELYFKKVGEFVKTHGYAVTNEVTRRKSYMEDWDVYLFCKSHIQKFKRDSHPVIVQRYNLLTSKYQRLAQNIPVQGTAADIAKYAGILLRKKSKQIGFKICLFVHDE
jgi:DNA polymerase I